MEAWVEQISQSIEVSRAKATEEEEDGDLQACTSCRHYSSEGFDVSECCERMICQNCLKTNGENATDCQRCVGTKLDKEIHNTELGELVKNC